jgi:hypothetical protein
MSCACANLDRSSALEDGRPSRITQSTFHSRHCYMTDGKQNQKQIVRPSATEHGELGASQAGRLKGKEQPFATGSVRLPKSGLPSVTLALLISFTPLPIDLPTNIERFGGSGRLSVVPAENRSQIVASKQEPAG